jgi:hypothetical protein
LTIKELVGLKREFREQLEKTERDKEELER